MNQLSQPPAASAPSAGRLALFALTHVLLIGGTVAWAAARYQHYLGRSALPLLRDEPLRITPEYNDPQMLSDAELITVLTKLRPRLAGPNPQINHVDHALRFWGIEAVFADPECLSGIELREILVDHRRFNTVWKQQGTKPFLKREPEGIAPAVKQGAASASHYDHTLASLAEVGTPLDYPVITPEGEFTTKELLEYSLKKFSLNQQEYEWSAVAFAHYLIPNDGWITTEGQHVTFDRIARRIMREQLSEGVCYGNHRLHALVVLLRTDSQQQILQPETRAEVIDYLESVTQTLVTSQNEDGSWNRNWDGIDREDATGGIAPITAQILATGHALEWWALAPEEVQPPVEVRRRAARWLVATISEMSDSLVRKNYTFLTHAGRALALWRGRFPADVDLQHTES